MNDGLIRPPIEKTNIFTEDAFVADDDYYDTMAFPQEENIYTLGDFIVIEEEETFDLLEFFL